jgi:hypothetical protein
MAIDVLTGQAASMHVADEPCNLLLYGPPGTNKTTDAVQAFTRDGKPRAFFIQCEPGALKPILARGIPVPDHPKTVVSTWEDLVDACTYAGQHRDRYDAVIIDTLTAWNASVLTILESRGGKNKYLLWTEIRNMLFQLRDGCRALGLHIIYIAHESMPFIDEHTNYHLGGPTLSPKTAIGRFSGGIDTMLRVGYILQGLEIKRVYFTGGEAWPNELGLPPPDLLKFRIKNRDGVNAAAVPADLGAYLRMRKPPYKGL